MGSDTSSNQSMNYRVWILIGFILILLAVTNPSKDDFVQWVVNSSKAESDNEWVDAGINLFGSSVINGVTTQQDLIFVSIFKMRFGTEKTSVLGLTFFYQTSLNLVKESIALHLVG